MKTVEEVRSYLQSMAGRDPRRVLDLLLEALVPEPEPEPEPEPVPERNADLEDESPAPSRRRRKDDA